MFRNLITRAVRLTRREYFFDFFVTPPITAALAGVSLGRGLTILWLLAFAAGFFLWTLYEYGLHRWALHRCWLLRDVHNLHHDDQRDYIALHPALTVSIYAATWALFGFGSSAVMVGFSAGYVLYAAAHTAFHYAAIGAGDRLFRLKRRHALHHVFENVNYGVTSPLWDIVFRTEFVAKPAPADAR